jgi:hypothetical protein
VESSRQHSDVPYSFNATMRGVALCTTLALAVLQHWSCLALSACNSGEHLASMFSSNGFEVTTCQRNRNNCLAAGVLQMKPFPNDESYIDRVCYASAPISSKDDVKSLCTVAYQAAVNASGAVRLTPLSTETFNYTNVSSSSCTRANPSSCHSRVAVHRPQVPMPCQHMNASGVLHGESWRSKNCFGTHTTIFLGHQTRSSLSSFSSEDVAHPYCQVARQNPSKGVVRTELCTRIT